MSYLDGKRVYLGGPIQYDTSPVNWRIAVKEVLINEFKLDLTDPFDSEKQHLAPKLKEAAEREDITAMVEVAKAFVRADLHSIDFSHFTISYLPYRIPTTGTCHE